MAQAFWHTTQACWYTCLCSDWKVGPTSSGLQMFSWIPYSRVLGFESSCRWPLLVSSHSVWGSTQLSSPQPVWRTWTAVPYPSAKTSAYAAQVQDRGSQARVWPDQRVQTTTRKHRARHREAHTARYTHLQAFRQRRRGRERLGDTQRHSDTCFKRLVCHTDKHTS